MSTPRILFVDDEPLVLQGYRNLLWRERKDWELVFADSGEQALVEMKQRPFDVIISDMRMPGMGGAELLAEVSVQYPAVVRMVLSGHASRAAMLEAVPVAHQCMSKPCEGSVLRGAIIRALGLRAVLGDDTLRRVLGKITRLPSVPKTYLDLCQALNDPNRGIDDISGIVASDSAMSIRVLQLVNSACFGSPSPTSSIEQAVRILGVELLKGLALMGNVLSAAESRSVVGLSLERLQANWVTSSRLAKRFTKDSSKSDSSFAAALVRDIGKIIIALEFPDKQLEITEQIKLTGRPDFVVEKEVLETTHAELGAYLLGMWGLPFVIVESVAFHHVPHTPTEGNCEVVAAVHVAATIGDVWDLSNPPPDPAAFLDMAFLQSAGFAGELPRWLDLAKDEWHKTRNA